MEIKVITNVGKSQYEFIINENKELEALHKAIILGNPPQYCGECKNNQFFKLDSNKDKEGNIYVNVVCSKCGAKAKLGQYKTGGYFWHKFEKWQKENEKTINADDEEINPDEIPF